jgi:hypothetical protein
VIFHDIYKGRFGFGQTALLLFNFTVLIKLSIFDKVLKRIDAR